MPRITESVIGSTLGLDPIFLVDLDLRAASLMAFFAGPLLLDMVFSLANALASTTSIVGHCRSSLMEATASARKCKADAHRAD